MTRPPRTRWSFAALVTVVGLGVGLSTASLGRPHLAAQAAPPVSLTTVSSVDRVCPAVDGPAGARTWVLSATGRQPAAGRASVTRLGDDTVLGRPLTGPAQVGVTPLGGAGAARVVHAGGPLAAEVDAVELTRVGAGAERGLSAVRCELPGTSFTFLGVATTPGDDPVLHVANPGDEPALVDVTLAGQRGAVNADGAQGLRVGAHQQVTLQLVGVAAAQPLLAVTVTARTGQVVAALHDTRREGSIARGADWVPPAGPAATVQTVPGLFQASGRHTVYVANPGSTDATVQVALARPGGTFVPNGLAAVPVPAGTVRAVDVSAAVHAEPVGAVVRSDRPVFAAASTVLAGSGTTADIAFTAAPQPLSGPVVSGWVGDARTHRRAGITLVAPQAGATVAVRLLGSTTSFTVAVPAGASVAFDPGARLHRTTGPLAVELSPLDGGGPVYAAAYWFESDRTGPMLAEVPLDPQPGVVVVPPTHPDPAADRR